MTTQNRYYVQTLTSHIFVIRERTSVDEEPGYHDRLVKSFDLQHDAVLYANNVNDIQRELDEHHGHWVQSAV